MGRGTRGAKGVGKGAPSGIIISILVHVGAFVLAGALVVFTVTNKKEQIFEAPKPVERPKMKLKKPKVKVKKNSRPQSSSRIVTKVDRASMPDIKLPEMSGMGQGFEGGVGGFEIELDMNAVSLLGSPQSIGSDLEGTYYDLKLGRSGNFKSADVEQFRHHVIRFVESGFRPSTLSRFYRSPNKIYATCILIPPTISSIAPAAFGDDDASGAQWMVHYKGKLVHAEGITFRFWAAADETMLVNVDDEFVIGAKWASISSGDSNVQPDTITPFWLSSSIQSYRFVIGNSRAAVGDWITLEPGVAKDLNIVIADNGGEANFFLAVEVKDVKYPTNNQGAPILPAFKTSEISRDMLDLIYRELVPDEINLTNGPVFNDYSASAPAAVRPDEAVEPAEETIADPALEKGPRAWTVKGKEFEAEFVTVIARDAVLKLANGKNLRVPLGDLEGRDLRYVELARPPEFRINFVKNCNQKTFVMSSHDQYNIRPPEKRCLYGLRLKQMSANDYNHPVNIEFYSVGQERLGQKYILLDRGKVSFQPTRKNNRSFEHMSEREVALRNYNVSGEPRGETYAKHLIIITDQRGEVIGLSGADWLYENVDALRELRPGNYFNKQCERIFPTQPPRMLY